MHFVDLFSLNVQRGRDHGLESYNAARISMGLKPYASFDEYFPKDELKARQFEVLYGSPDNMDLWVGIISEPSVPGSIFGELGIEITAMTFKNIRNGDRFWYEKLYTK